MPFDPWEYLSFKQLKAVVESFPANQTRWSVKLRLFERTADEKIKWGGNVQTLLAGQPILQELKESSTSRISDMTITDLTSQEVVQLYEKVERANEAEDQSRRSVEMVDDTDSNGQECKAATMKREREAQRVQNHPLFAPFSCSATVSSTNLFTRESFEICERSYFVLNGTKFLASPQLWLPVLQTCKSIHCPIFYSSLQDIVPGCEYRADVLTPILIAQMQNVIDQQTKQPTNQKTVNMID